ncbi:hypothetical protein Tsubulata_010370 [Turnera subulata]|uniref:Zinc finger protein 830 n=1 Tax=Turnera subulata TaxID=218843 RepID=A0A9Q0G2Q1_9ROSI|nr:hypothetical protein Tsubulata_010370 [Turnera subulata]
MDAAKKKALFRAKLNEQRKDKRIDSPLVRYNELDQPVCRVCNVVLKHESQWDAHQASRKHIEAINNLRANATGRTNVNSVEPKSTPTESSRSKRPHVPESEPSAKIPKSQSALPPDFFDNNDLKGQKSTAQKANMNIAKAEPPQKLSKPQSSSALPLPSGFFDNHESEHQKNDGAKTLDQDAYKRSVSSVRAKVTASSMENKLNGSSASEIQKRNPVSAADFTTTKTEIVPSDSKQVKGALPEGFFDDKDADLRARGIKPVKPDVKDEYKEFEKLIQEDLQEVDNRLEEDEIDAAVTIEEAESVEQKFHLEKVELLKKKKMELKAARSANRSSSSKDAAKEAGLEESSSDDDSDDNFSVDWRAQHL